MNVGNINHGQIHANPAHDRHFGVMQRGIAFIGFQYRDAVRIPRADNGNAHIARRSIARIITQSFTFGDFADLQDWREQCHNRARIFLLRVIRGVTPVETNTGTDHLKMIGLTQINTRRIGQAHRGERKLRGGFFKPRELCIIERVIFVRRAGQMAHHPFGVQRLPKFLIAGKLGELIRVEAKPVHPRINMDGGIRRLIDRASNLGPLMGLRQRINDGFKLRAQKHTFVTRRRPVQDINRAVGPNGVAQDFSFASCRHEKDTAPCSV